MANHHDDGNFPRSELLESMLSDFKGARGRDESFLEQRMIPNVELGKQNDFPEGRYGPTDEGAIAFAFGHDAQNGKVFLDFNTPVKWMAMDPEQAVHLAEHLIQHARKASKKPLTVSI